MYNLIYQLKEKELGTGLMSINMEKTYPGLFRSFNIKTQKIPDYNRIWQIQNPYLYKFGMLKRANDHVFIRDKFSGHFVGKLTTNGFSYLREHRLDYDYFIPTIYKSHFGVSDTPSIGYYARDCRIQSNIEFSLFLNTIQKGTQVVTMGTKELIEDKIPSRVEWFHTYDNSEFWNSCSHFFYYRCSDIQDPLPHTILEAIQSNHRIISPVNKNRQFKDGIDDLISCIDYDEDFYPDNTGDYCQFLDPDNWGGFMQKIAEDDFRITYPVNRPSFREWILENL